MMKKSYEKIIWVAIILLFLGAVIRIVIPYFFPQENYLYNYSHMYGGMNFGMGAMSMGIFWIIIVLVIVYFVFNQKQKQDTTSDNLKKRLANGEITIEEYEKIKNKINE